MKNLFTLRLRVIFVIANKRPVPRVGLSINLLSYTSGYLRNFQITRNCQSNRTSMLSLLNAKFRALDT